MIRKQAATEKKENQKQNQMLILGWGYLFCSTSISNTSIKHIINTGKFLIHKNASRKQAKIGEISFILFRIYKNTSTILIKYKPGKCTFCTYVFYYMYIQSKLLMRQIMLVVLCLWGETNSLIKIKFIVHNSFISCAETQLYKNNCTMFDLQVHICSRLYNCKLYNKKKNLPSPSNKVKIVSISWFQDKNFVLRNCFNQKYPRFVNFTLFIIHNAGCGQMIFLQQL
eukprot:TRINITY_DN12370_c0_g1_i2.p1 TRINITY_DN12370_c0_g1~~TRINITY_DN12370_c0_g1_i2.p1  ORF type:complete len:258 (-),score=-16.17 TRINITY_DN12370_c0_g1_i2:331-1008(-)